MHIVHGRRAHVYLNSERHWPLAARAATFVLEAADSSQINLRERRSQLRPPLRLEATLSPADDPLAQVLIYTRDTDSGHIGFICQQPLPRRYQVDLHLTLEAVESLHLRATVMRCRPFMERWYEGVLRFHDEPRAFNIGY